MTPRNPKHQTRNPIRRIHRKWYQLACFLLIVMAIYLAGCKAGKMQATVKTDTTYVPVSTIEPLRGITLPAGESFTIGTSTITSLGNGTAVVEAVAPLISRTELVPIAVKTKTVIKKSGNVTDKSKEVYKTSDDDKVITKTKDLQKSTGIPWWLVLVVLAGAAAVWFLNQKLRIL